MRIKYFTEDSILFIKENSKVVFEKCIKGKHSLQDIFGNAIEIKETPFEIEDFDLDISQPKGKESLTDVENVQRVYNHMKSLSDSQATDERIWVANTLEENIDYMRYRWNANSFRDMENRYLFNYSPQRSLFRNGMARLWWIGRVTYDKRRTDPYELTKYMCRNQDFIESICGRNVFNNEVVQKATIEAMYDAENAGILIDRSSVRDISKYVNLLAGNYLIDIFEYDEIYKRIFNRLERNLEGK